MTLSVFRFVLITIFKLYRFIICVFVMTYVFMGYGKSHVIN